ncbi:retinol dehydrogenase 7-like [Ptychodera flava]|uniref:retinol dehydrogenase 7-like n=1 Tax=Ptychodera flava TaxID=63121 RepID=UPI00396A2574
MPVRDNYDFVFLIEALGFLYFVITQHYHRVLRIDVRTLFLSIVLGLPICQDIIGGLFGLLLFTVLCTAAYVSFPVDDGAMGDRVTVNGKAVLITGCDTGFGHETAIRLDQLGFTVFAGCLNKDGDGSRRLRARSSDRLVTLQLDVTDDKQVEDAVSVIKSNVGSGGLWGLVNNAGVSLIGAIELLPMEIFEKVYNVNLLGTIRVTKAFLPLVRKAKGRIVNFSSTSGVAPVVPFAAYCVSKAGVEIFSDVLRQEMLDWSVKVSVIQPAGFQTDIVSRSRLEPIFHQMMTSLTADVKEDYDVESFRNKFSRVLERDEILQGYVSDDLVQVTEKVEDALTSSTPRHRYPVGRGARLLTWVATYLPSWITDGKWTMAMPDYLIVKPKKNT